MIVVLAVLAVLIVASAWAVCVLAKRGELRAAIWARPADVDDIAERRASTRGCA